MAQDKAPRITFFQWGKLRIEGYDHDFRDAKLSPAGAIEWDWSRTNMHHDPGIQPVDVEEFLEAGIEVIILSKGVDEKLKTMPETIRLLEQHGIITHVLQTEKAIEKYNALCATSRIAALIHSTC